MGKLIDLTGQRFGKWIVLQKVSKPNDTSACWLCRCDCGNTKIVRGKDLRYGKSKSCGCSIVKHGGEKSRLYTIWRDMKTRCLNPSAHCFKDYGGRGISICKEWENDFSVFREWAINNGYDENAPKGQCTIDRIDNNGSYAPDNCRWITQKEQCNNRRNSHLLTYNNENHTIAEWADIKKIPYQTLRRRLFKLDWPIEEALEKPVKKYKCRRD